MRKSLQGRKQLEATQCIAKGWKRSDIKLTFGMMGKKELRSLQKALKSFKDFIIMTTSF